MDTCSLEKRVRDAVERWTVFRLVESHLDAAVLERFKEDVCRSVLQCSESLRAERSDSLCALAYGIQGLLDDLCVDVDMHSCSRMATILADICMEFADGRSDVYQRLVQARPAECECESSE